MNKLQSSCEAFKLSAMKYYDFIVIGSGISGLNFALNASEKGKVLIITKKHILESNTNYAQGGIAAVLDKLDNFKKHIDDTLEAGAYHNNKQAVRYMVTHGPKLINKLAQLGVPFAEKDQKLMLTKEGGHSAKRIAFVGDRTGNAIEKTLVKAVHEHSKITIWENSFAVDLLVKNKKCYGLYVLKNNKIEKVFASAVILATGGLGQVYKKTTNPNISTGDGFAMAARAGCKVKDLEFVQFHPTALDLPRRKSFLISEALRGEGAVLRNNNGERFMSKYDKRKELAPRDIVARAIFQESKKGTVCLDITHENSKITQERFPTIHKKLKKIGIDITKQCIPVSPAAHYACGGIQVNLKGETNIKNLYAFGEVACTGVHGANRLGSNSLLEAVVFSDQILEKLKISKSKKIPSFPPYLLNKKSSGKFSYVKQRIKKIMWNYVGIIRTEKGLSEALKTLMKLKKSFHPTSKNIKEFETQNLLEIAILITKAAIKRKKSLGCHFIDS